MQQMRKAVVSALDTAGGIAGAGLIFCGVLLAVIGASDRRLLTVGLAIAFLIAGSVLAFKKRTGGVRAIAGAVFLILIVVSFFAAIFMPNLHYR